jgi:hypothetical protein
MSECTDDEVPLRDILAIAWALVASASGGTMSTEAAFDRGKGFADAVLERHPELTKFRP